jgi:single-stranded-DNA-specific exonuclease
MSAGRAGGSIHRPRIVQRQCPAEHALPAALHAVTRRVLAARGVTAETLMDTSLKGLLQADGLGGMSAAVALLAEVMAAGGRILIIGDFDADGATSTALAVRALRAMGARTSAIWYPTASSTAMV